MKRAGHRHWHMAGGLCLLFALLALGGEDWRLALRYERGAIAQGQWWRLLSGHFVHLGWAHAALNAAGVLVCAALAPPLWRARGLPALLAALALGASGLLWGLSPQVAHYAGFSGVLYGLFLLALWPQRHERLIRLALWLVPGWALLQLLGLPLGPEERAIGGRIVPQAHVYGLALAACWLLASAAARRWRALAGGAP